MKTLYWECQMGAAGDMILAALYELLDDKPAFLNTLNHMGLPHVTYHAIAGQTCGISGVRMQIIIDGEEEESVDVSQSHHHSHHQHDHDHGHQHQAHSHSNSHTHSHTHNNIGDIKTLITSLHIPQPVRDNALAIYRRLAEAESKVHGRPVEMVHFHEVGALDAVADIVGVCYALYLLQISNIIVSPIHVGQGQVRCAHGIVPVPAPATVELLKGIPYYSGNLQGELCTPTGAAIIAHFATSFGPCPVMCTQQTGYGLGKKEFPAANCIRIFLGTTQEDAPEPDGEIVELVCNIDDMTPEALAYACEVLLEKGALDVYTAPIMMKKGRQGVLLTALCQKGDEEEIAQHIFKNTTTNGMRVRYCGKYFLKPSFENIESVYGNITIKKAEGHGTARMKPEYGDIAKIAKENQLSFSEVWDSAMAQAAKAQNKQHIPARKS